MLLTLVVVPFSELKVFPFCSHFYRYLGSRTPEHIKKKVIELLYLWTRELRSETKISEAYSMLKAQGIVRQDPDYVGSAVFAASLPPRRQEDSPLTREQNRQLKTLLQSRNPEDLQRANKIIKVSFSSFLPHSSAISSALLNDTLGSLLLLFSLESFPTWMVWRGER